MSLNYLRASRTRKKDLIIFCVTCLSTSDVRKMYTVDDLTFFSSITLIQVPSNSVLKVCWECKGMFDKIKMFRRRALKANFLMSKMSTKIFYTPLTSLVENKLNSWISISYEPLLVYTSLGITSETLDNPLSETTDPTTSVKKEVIENEHVSCDQQEPYLTVVESFPKELAVENETLSFNKQEPYLPVVDPFPKEMAVENETLSTNKQDSHLIREGSVPLHSEVEIKIEDPIEDDSQPLDIVKCEYASSSDDEPLINSVKGKTHQIIQKHRKDDSDTDSATEIPPSPPHNPKTQPRMVKTIRLTSPPQMSATPNMATMPKIPSILHKETSSSVELPLAFAASSLLMNSFPKPEETVMQTKSENKVNPVQYHTGPKLFKNSPQLTIPEMFRNIEPPKQTTYVIRKITQEEVNEYRAGRIKLAKDRHWQFFCVKCLDKFTKSHEYEVHFKKHDEISGPLVCNICELRYPTQKELDNHKQMHFRKYVCDECKEEFFTMKSLFRHNDLVHEDVLKFCRHCDMKFTNKKEYYMHNRRHIQMVKCEQCNRELKKDTLPQHMRDCHGPKELLKCEICNKVFEGKRKLRSHMRYIHSPQEDSAYCVECNVTFRNQVLYLAHLKNTMRHRGKEDTFKCPHCARCFATSWYLKKHIEVLHGNRELSQCDMCKRMYKSKKAVRSHIMKFHLKMKMPSEQRNKVCDICGKAFMSKSCLEQHINSHLNIRPYQCEQCGATFSYSGARFTHIRLKHQNKENKT